MSTISGITSIDTVQQNQTLMSSNLFRNGASPIKLVTNNPETTLEEADNGFIEARNAIEDMPEAGETPGREGCSSDELTQSDIDQAKKKLELKRIELQQKKIEAEIKELEENKGKKKKKNNGKSWLENTTKDINDANKFVRSITNLTNSIRRLCGKRTRHYY